MEKAVNQTDTELATGLSREVLRKWEERYQFPQPARDERGRRVYSGDDIARLQRIKELLDCGYRPRQLLMRSFAELTTMHPAAMQVVPFNPKNDIELTEALLAALQPTMAPQALPKFLHARLQHVGLDTFAHEDMPRFNAAVGEAWACGRLSVTGEHYYTATVSAMVRTAIARLRIRPNAPRILLTTPPTELHALGLLALEATLALQGALCISLGTQTPVKNLLAASQGWCISVVALSISETYPAAAALRYIKQIRRGLHADCALWVGGGGARALEASPVEGAQRFESTQDAVAAWKARQTA